jgi:hypothetical protein
MPNWFMQKPQKIRLSAMSLSMERLSYLILIFSHHKYRSLASSLHMMMMMRHVELATATASTIKSIKRSMKDTNWCFLIDFLCSTKCTVQFMRDSFMRAALQRHNTENSKQIFPERELRGLNPNFQIHVSVSDLYIPTILGIYKSLTET